MYSCYHSTLRQIYSGLFYHAKRGFVYYYYDYYYSLISLLYGGDDHDFFVTFIDIEFFSQEKYDVHHLVLLTNDRNLRLRARAHDIQTRDLPSFFKWLVSRSK